VWAWFAKRPQAYRIATRAAIGALKLLGRRKGSFKSLPLAGSWTAGRDLPVPEGGTFMDRYAQQQRGR
jgi:L-lactate dehydrogenase complex protein LldF